MEIHVASPKSGSGSGDGNGYGYGYGYGDGYGDGNGYGYGACHVSDATPIMAWHYVSDDGRLRFEHGGVRHVAKPGLVLEWDGDVEMCNQGLHASIEKADAAKYLESGVLCRVACSGQVIFGQDKLVCSRREVVEVIHE